MKGIRVFTAAVAAASLAGCGGGQTLGLGPLTGDCRAAAPDAPEFESVDWTQVRQVNLRIRDGEYTPSLVRLYQDKAYVFRIENRDDSTRRFQAGRFFANLKVHSIESATRTLDATCPSGLALEAGEAIQIRFIAARDGRYEFDETLVPLPFVTAPAGVILVEEAPYIAALLQSPVPGLIGPPGITTAPYETKPDAAAPQPTPAAVTPPGAPAAPPPPAAPAGPVEIKRTPEGRFPPPPAEGAPAVPGEATPESPAAPSKEGPQGGLPMIPPPGTPLQGASPPSAPAAPLEMIRSPEPAVAPQGALPMTPPQGALPMTPPADDMPKTPPQDILPKESLEDLLPKEPPQGALPPAPMPERPAVPPQGAAPSEAMPELPPGIAPAEEPKPAEKSDRTEPPREAVAAPTEEEFPAMTATGAPQPPPVAASPARPRLEVPADVSAPLPPPLRDKAATPTPVEERKASAAPSAPPATRAQVADAERPARPGGPLSRFFGRVGALYGD